ncbi:hypothetical protein SDC9_149542 [bioreactor metagenome]|uniref:Uncharacterized protein n=1 Tax=bioreactor metagenome TaxID=1076179 RepID=A0A645ELJ5_9ZZZZ
MQLFYDRALHARNVHLGDTHPFGDLTLAHVFDKPVHYELRFPLVKMLHAFFEEILVFNIHIFLFVAPDEPQEINVIFRL